MMKNFFSLVVILVILTTGTYYFFFQSHDNRSSKKLDIQHKVKTGWNGDTQWYFVENVDFLGYRKKWLKFSISNASKNYCEEVIFGNKKIKFPSYFVIEGYKKNKNDKNIIYRVYLEKPGDKENIESIFITFDNDEMIECPVRTHEGIKSVVIDSFVEYIIDKLKRSKSFVIEYDNKKAYFENKQFKAKLLK